jgi:hypothetical protein
MQGCVNTLLKHIIRMHSILILSSKKLLKPTQYKRGNFLIDRSIFKAKENNIFLDISSLIY